MNWTLFVLRNLRYHVRGNLAVLLGTAVGAAVLTGALLVGDSLRGSLRERTARQLGNVDNVLMCPRFLRAEIASELPGQVRGALLLQSSVHLRNSEKDFTADKVTVWGVNGAFGINRPELDTDKPVAILSANLAKALHAKIGESITVAVQKSSAMPRASFIAKRGISDTTRTIKLTLIDILPDSDPANALSLSISPTLPSNMFIPIARLQREIGQDGRINVLLGSGQSAQALQSELRARLTLDDWGLTVRIAPFRKTYISVESSRLLLEPAVVAAVEKTARNMGIASASTYVYLANSISHGREEIPYSLVAALDPQLESPLGPFLPEGVDHLDPDQIVLVDWKESPIKISSGERNPQIKLRYFKPEIEGKIEEDEHTFTFRGLVPLKGAAGDRDLTPSFPGITDQATLKDWNPPFDIDKQRIQRRDEKYWEQYRTTPKAYIRLDDGQKIWGTRFGNVTSVRIGPEKGIDLEQTRTEFARQLRENLDPETGGMIVQPIRERMSEAGQGSTDFGMLFLAFSFFLIVSALMLVALLFRLNLDRRAREIGLLRASGYPLRTVRWLLLVEGLILAMLGALIGLIGSLGYASAMIRLLVSLWPTAGVESYLHLHVSPQSLAIGFLAAVLMSAGAILWALRALNRVTPSQLLKGETTPASDVSKPRRSRRSRALAIISSLSALVLVVIAPRLPAGEPQAGAFFGSGSLFLISGLALLWMWMRRSRHRSVSGQGAMSLANLGARNAVRHPTRSMLTAGLLAAAAFLLVAVESFRREPYKDFGQKTGGSGGFLLLGESSAPIDFDLNDEEGKAQLEDGLKRHYQDQGLPFDRARVVVEQSMDALKDVKIYPFRVQGGDDASCLNLYQANRPRVLGAPRSIIERGGFAFSDSLASSLEEKANPWKLLETGKTGEPIPCILETNTATWMFGKGLGDILEVRDEENHPIQLRLVGLLQDSVFQSEVIISDAAFRNNYPHTEGFAYFLIETPPERLDAVSSILRSSLANYGLETSSTRDRVASFLTVQNTYLTTFQLLGAFGLLLGVLGLSVVLLRNIWERRSEMALLRALGYRVRALHLIILAENGLLLVLGLGLGVVAALAAVAPHLVAGDHVPWARLSLMLGMVVIVGVTVAWLAMVTNLRAPLIPALRKE